MSDLTVNGRRVLDAAITLGRRGAWHAELEVDTADVLGPDATIEATGGLRLVGTVYRGGVYQQRAQLQVVGGRGGLAKPLAPQYYRDAPLRIPVRDLLALAGETLSPTADAALLDTTHGAWVRERAPASVALAHLLDTIAANWRVLPDGAVWIGTETWPTVDLRGYDLLGDAPATDTATLATDAIPAALLPGTVFRGRRVNKVTHRVTPRATRTALEYEPDDNASPEDRGMRAFNALVGLETRRAIYYGLFPARVVTQAADGTLEVVPDDDSIPPMTGVALRTFLPSTAVRVGAGGRVLVGFEAGDPRRPYAALWNGGALDTVEIPAGATDFVALASKVHDALTKLQNALDTHTHSGGTLSGALTGPPSTVPTVMPVGPLASVAATKLKAQ